jgi:hypothetical protein
MTKNRDLNDNVLFADLNFRTPTSKPPKPTKPPKKRKSRFRWLFLIIICGALFGGAITMGWYSYMRGYDTASDEFAPHIAADDAPIKMKPDEPGGMKIPHQNRHVYDMVTSPENRERKVEHLLPPPEVPLLAQSVEEPVEDNPSQNLEQLREEANAAERNIESIVKTQPIQEVPQQPEIIPDEKPEIEAPIVAEKKSFDDKLAELIPQEKPKIAEPKEVIIEKKEIVQAAPVIVPDVKIAPKNTQTTSANIRLQLGAVKTAQEAQKEIGRLRKAYPDIFKNCDLIAKNVDLGPKGIFYRIQTTGMPQAEAEKINEMLKKLKQACFIVKP